MKKLTILAVAAILTLGGASSCKKARTCTCADGTQYPMGSAKLSDQKTACTSACSLEGSGGGSVK